MDPSTLWAPSDLVNNRGNDRRGIYRTAIHNAVVTCPSYQQPPGASGQCGNFSVWRRDAMP